MEFLDERKESFNLKKVLFFGVKTVDEIECMCEISKIKKYIHWMKYFCKIDTE